jgi:DeoR/GlpR family transcriptional regulator of sugar metabolism
MDRLLKEERQQKILEMLQQRKRVTVPELSRQFNASEVTIRRDLHDLAATGKLQRAHRGALETVSAPPEPPVVQRMALEQAHKEQIARAALDLIPDGSAIFIGSGSTTMLLARLLVRKNHLTVVTNALNIASELAQAGGRVTVVVTGGEMRDSELSLLGHIAEQSLHEVRVDRILMGAQAVDPSGGWTTDHLPEVSTTRRILEMASELVILADHSKLGRRAPAFIAPIRRISTLITDPEADPDLLSEIRAQGVQVTIAPARD